MHVYESGCNPVSLCPKIACYDDVTRLLVRVLRKYGTLCTYKWNSGHQRILSQAAIVSVYPSAVCSNPPTQSSKIRCSTNEFRARYKRLSPLVDELQYPELVIRHRLPESKCYSYAMAAASAISPQQGCESLLLTVLSFAMVLSR